MKPGGHDAVGLRLPWRTGVAILFVASAACGRSAPASAGAGQGGTSDIDAIPVEVVQVIVRRLQTTVRIPGELQPFEVVAVYPKVAAFVESIGVDRGSEVKRGQVIARLVAPELAAQRAEAQSKVQSAEALRIEAEARLAADTGTFERIKAAASTPGVVSQNEVDVAEKTMEAERARAQSLRESEDAARSALAAVREVEGYLQVKAPFDGMVTERNVHPGALVGPAGGSGEAPPMLRIENLLRLRLVVPVPEIDAADIERGARVVFSVSAYPGETFEGTLTRIAHSVDVRTRSMPVELDVENQSRRLAPGMFPEVVWPVRRARDTLFVPAGAVGRTTERRFVVCVRDGKAVPIDVTTGASVEGLVEIFGDVHDGDQVARRATDELRAGTHVAPRLVPAS